MIKAQFSWAPSRKLLEQTEVLEVDPLKRIAMVVTKEITDFLANKYRLHGEISNVATNQVLKYIYI